MTNPLNGLGEMLDIYLFLPSKLACNHKKLKSKQLFPWLDNTDRLSFSQDGLPNKQWRLSESTKRDQQLWASGEQAKGTQG